MSFCLGGGRGGGGCVCVCLGVGGVVCLSSPSIASCVNELLGVSMSKAICHMLVLILNCLRHINHSDLFKMGRNIEMVGLPELCT